MIAPGLRRRVPDDAIIIIVTLRIYVLIINKYIFFFSFFFLHYYNHPRVCVSIAVALSLCIVVVVVRLSQYRTAARWSPDTTTTVNVVTAYLACGQKRTYWFIRLPGGRPYTRRRRLRHRRRWPADSVIISIWTSGASREQQQWRPRKDCVEGRTCTFINNTILLFIIVVVVVVMRNSAAAAAEEAATVRLPIGRLGIIIIKYARRRWRRFLRLHFPPAPFFSFHPQFLSLFLSFFFFSPPVLIVVVYKMY